MEFLPSQFGFLFFVLLLLGAVAALAAVRRARGRLAESGALGDRWPGPAATLDSGLCLRSANAAFKALGPGGEVLGKTLREVLGPQAFEAVRPALEQAREASPAGRGATVLLGISDRSFLATVVPQAGGPGGADSVGLYLSEQAREAPAAGTGSGGAVADDATVRGREEFLSRIVHDLRTPLQSILGWISLVRSRRLAESESTRALEVIENNARMLAKLLDQILDHVLLIRGQLKLELRQVELAPVLREVGETLQPAAEGRGVRLEIEASPAAPARADLDRLHQILHVLVQNAIKFTPRGGKVRVRAQSSAGQACVSVEDEGPGLRNELIPDLFTSPVLRQPGERRKGLGLGLVSARYLVELHGGSIRAGNRQDGRGAIFTVCLPAGEPEVAPEPWAPVIEETRSQAGSPAPGGSPILAGLRVLAVDDDADTRKLLEVVLGKYGAQVKAVSSAAEALREVTTESSPRPDVLICDIAMPEESGYDLIHKVRMLKPERGGRIPAIALTGYTSAVDRMRALAAGFQNHVSKPIEPHELSTVIASVASRLI